jgi:uncharacterized protein YecT (DUF1311 family)
VKQFLTILLIAFTHSSFSQILIKKSEIISIEKNHQLCLDKGVFMSECSIHYFNQMDSCLNVAYNQLLVRLKPSQKEIFKREQLSWLKSKKEVFDRINKTNKVEGQDGKMIRTDLKADYVKERVLFLIQQIEKDTVF